MDDEIKKALIKSGFKEKDIQFLNNLAKRKNISIGKAFFLYSWRYYAWSLALLAAILFSSIHEDIEYLVGTIIIWSMAALVSLLFTPFFRNLAWCIRVQVILWVNR